MDKERILGFDVCVCNEEELLNNIFIDYNNKEQIFIVNINPEISVANYENEDLKNKFNAQKYQIPDGNGIVWASKKKKGKIKSRIAGIDLMIKLCEKFQEYDSKIYLYGAKPGVAEKAKKELEKTYPKINIVGTSDGYCNEEKVVEDIKEKQPDILFVGTGSPRQEKFILKYKEGFTNTKILMPVGGSFDVISKNKKRAPKWVIKLKLEWLFRALIEPSRIKGQFRLIKFVRLIKKEK